ncbi:glycosyltransferase involved in cell wall biosynthesis [Neorhizobium sp. 2083]|uniref:glycosyltransferase n=1 Tax=Neorhizobium sp. 2083 TaxID=2817762 RepID=UPI002859E80C|nr:glycosyltransferase [Neorhizobium sp. 2083]MDR6821061.1 glycosyltransferase involved in cell wall biosynthesis [Neorhizobium sp. 2083]
MNIALLTKSREHGSREIFLCFSHLRWNFVFQRPQHLLTRATGTYDVSYWEEPVFEDVPAAWLHRSMSDEGVEIVVPHLPQGRQTEAAAMQAQLLEDFLSDLRRPPSVLWYYTPMALEFSRWLNANIIVYDNMDELSAFDGAPPEVVAFENEMFSISDVVFTGGQSLYEAKKGRHENIHPFPSSIDTSHFNKAREADCDPPDQSAIRHPRIGFFGVIDERMDIDLLSQAADMRPNWQFVMIGPVVKVDPRILPRRENVHWLGPKSYKELPTYLAHWDMGLMPFALNDATRFISPTKTPEFLAAGLPVLSTMIRDVVRPYGDLGLVEIIDGAEDLCARTEILLDRPKQHWLSRVDELLAQNSWDQTWAAMQAHMARVSTRTSLGAQEAAYV